MKGVAIGVNKASMVNDNGKSFTATREGMLWIVDGIGYKDPFEAFKAIERSAENGNSNSRHV